MEKRILFLSAEKKGLNDSFRKKYHSYPESVYEVMINNQALDRDIRLDLQLKQQILTENVVSDHDVSGIRIIYSDPASPAAPPIVIKSVVKYLNTNHRVPG